MLAIGCRLCLRKMPVDGDACSSLGGSCDAGTASEGVSGSPLLFFAQ